MPNQHVKVSFDLSDGRVLSCEYNVSITYGVHTLSNGDPGYPDEADVGEPEYELDGQPIEVSKLPKGLEHIANEMYEASEGDPRFHYESEFEEPDFDEPEYWD